MTTIDRATITAALAYSHRPRTQAWLYDVRGAFRGELAIESGSISIDGSRATKRSLSLRTVDPTGVLIKDDTALSAFGSEILVQRGIRYQGGWYGAPLGLFRISEVSVEKSTGGTVIDITAYDRSRVLALSTFTRSFAVMKNTNVITAISTILALRMPWMSLSTTVSTDETTPHLAYEVGDDPWDAMRSLAATIGCEIYFDTHGQCTLRRQPDPAADDPVAWFVEGSESTVASITKSLSDEPGWNGVIVIGNPPEIVPVRGEVWETDPSSPIYYLGRYGQRALKVESQYIFNSNQAQSAAQAQFLRERGGTEQTQLTAIPNPYIDANDIVHVTCPDLAVDANEIVDTVNLPLGYSDLMSVTTRKRRFG
jgi:hypothetical protein